MSARFIDYRSYGRQAFFNPLNLVELGDGSGRLRTGTDQIVEAGLDTS
jgi:hypothetical protein